MASQEEIVEDVIVEESPCGATQGAKTSDFYRTKDIPNRFENPDWFQGYGGKAQHPMYRTSSAIIGSKPPSVHTVPTQFYCRSQKFSEHLGKCGMYRNHSLNTGMDKTNV